MVRNQLLPKEYNVNNVDPSTPTWVPHQEWQDNLSCCSNNNCPNQLTSLDLFENYISFA